MGFDMNLVGLFVTIVDTGTLSEAARQHGVTRAQVSKNLRKLESLLNTQLIRRTTRRLELTQQGQVLYQHGVSILKEMDAAKESIMQLGVEPVGKVRLSVPNGLGEMILLPMLADFQKQFPQLSLQIMFSNRVHNLIESQVDIALKFLTQVPEDYVAKKITDIRWMLCATPNYVQQYKKKTNNIDQLAAYEFLCPSNKLYELITFKIRGKEFKFKPKIRLQSESFSCLLEFARQDLGVALLPSYMFEKDIATGVLKEIIPDLQLFGLESSLYMLTTNRPHLNAAGIRVLGNYLQEKLSIFFEHR